MPTYSLSRMPYLGLALLAWLGSPAWAADPLLADHFISESKRTFMGHQSPLVQEEVWMDGPLQRTTISYGFLSLRRITRRDLGKYYFLCMDKKRYLEGSLTEKMENAPIQDSLKKTGFFYRPIYTWALEAKSTQTTGTSCHFHGEADYARKDWFVTVDGSTQVNAVGYFQEVLKPSLDSDLAGLYEKHVLPGLATKTRIVEEPSIAHEILEEIEIKTAEKAEPPVGVFEVPAGFTRVEKVDDLFK